jgi:hypothetical protein
MECSKDLVVPAYAYYILDYQQCDKIKFKNDKTIYDKHQLKGKEKWKDVRCNIRG